jgi:biotin carboxyl carrier protein
MKRTAHFQDQSHDLQVERTDQTITLTLDDQKHVFSYQHTSGGWILQKDGQVFHTNTLTRKANGPTQVMVNQHTLDITVEDPYALGNSLGDGAGAGEVTAVMPGRVLAIHVQSGDTVEEGQPLLVLEAMKMENVIKAPTAGNITAIDINQGDSVEAGQRMISITP